MLPTSPGSEAATIIARLGLQPLPAEGGWFRRTWTSPETFSGQRPAGTAIYFLLTPQDFSALHRLDADELWHFHAGDPVEHLQFSASVPDSAHISRLGADPLAGEVPQLVVPRGSWQGARLAAGATRGWALITCTMTPGWSEQGFTLASRSALQALHPSYTRLISALTRLG